MRRPGRRSRKIGLTQGGRVRDGRPAEKPSRRFSRDFQDDLAFLISAKAAGPPAILRENPSSAFFHPCEAEDDLAVLDRLPAALHAYLRAIILRRTPVRDFTRGVEARVRYGRVTMNAFPRSLLMTWSRGAGPAVRRHYGRWCAGEWNTRGDAVTLRWEVGEVRRYYLYHLFLHEIGHINQPWRYAARRREEFAENFALEWADRLG